MIPSKTIFNVESLVYVELDKSLAQPEIENMAINNNIGFLKFVIDLSTLNKFKLNKMHIKNL
jgi:hypothetical protein